MKISKKAKTRRVSELNEAQVVQDLELRGLEAAEVGSGILVSGGNSASSKVICGKNGVNGVSYLNGVDIGL